ncbi:MAG: zinc-binding dehydrogenase [Phototrophicaceae bacterium]
MKAYVITIPGTPDALTLKDIPDPIATDGQVHIQIAAFGLNRAEAVTRQGGSGNAVVFPRVIGIECVGTVINAPGTSLKPGQKVAALMGGMGRKFDGSYAEQTVVPVANVIPIDTTLAWTDFAAIPETFLTAWGCLFEALQVQRGAHVVMRPGASALGLAVTQIVNHIGGEVIGVTRSIHKVEAMKRAGMADVIVADGAVADDVRRIWQGGAIHIVETVTNSLTVNDNLKIKGRGGRVCIAGSLASSSGQSLGLGVMLAMLRPSVRIFSSERVTAAKYGEVLQAIVRNVESGVYKTNIAEVIPFANLVDAHVGIDSNRYVGKVVVRL